MGILTGTLEPRLGVLDRAIYSTVAYRDVFEFPVSIAEIHRYLHGRRCTLEEVAVALSNGPFRERYLETDGEYFALKGRHDLFPLRRARSEISRRQWPAARRHAGFLASLPNVRMVAMTGSLAASNSTEDGDIDFLLLTEDGTMWRTRALCRLLALLDKTFGKGMFCPNMFLSGAAMTLGRRSLYDAQELGQMIPLFGFVEYETVRRANSWTEQFLPNALGAPSSNEICEPRWPPLKHAAEWLLDSPLGRRLERFEADRKIRRFNETNHLKGAWTRSTRDAHSLWDDMRLKIERAWQHRMDAIASD